MTDQNDEVIEQALRAAGHEQVADGLRDRRLAADLRAAGHDHLAAQLADPPAAGQTVPTTPVPENASADAGAAFLEELRDALDSPWKSTPGLLADDR